MHMTHGNTEQFITGTVSIDYAPTIALGVTTQFTLHESCSIWQIQPKSDGGRRLIPELVYSELWLIHFANGPLGKRNVSNSTSTDACCLA